MLKKYLLIYLIFSFFIPTLWAQRTDMFRGDQSHSGNYPPASGSDLDDVLWNFKSGGRIFSSPAVTETAVYIGSEDKNLYALDPKTGNEIWHFETNGAVHSSPAVYNGIVYFGSYDGYYYALNALTGAEIWRFKTGGESKVGGKGLWGMQPSTLYMADLFDFFLSSPVIDTRASNPTLYFGSSDSTLYALDLASGRLNWSFKTNAIIHASPALWNNDVIFASWDSIYSFDAVNGTENWRTGTEGMPGDQMHGIQASPAIYDDVVYIGARDAYFYALDAGSGAVLWKNFTEWSWVVASASFYNGLVLCPTSDSHLMLALDATTHQEIYRFNAKGYLYSSPAVAGNTAFFGDFTGKLYALDLTSNGTVWKEFQTQASKDNAATVLNHDQEIDWAKLFGSNDPSQYSASVSGMDQLYTLGPIVSSPSVYDNVAYVGSADGNLYAFDLSDVTTSVFPSNGNTVNEKIKEVYCYPNPAGVDTRLHFTLKEAGETEVILYNNMGIGYTVWSSNIDKGQHDINVDLSAFPAGSYLLKVISSETFAQTKVVLKK